MTEPDTAAPRPSLIQQRMALQRKSRWAMYQLVVSLVLAAGWTSVVVVEGGSRIWPWIAAGAFLALAIACAFPLRSARRDTRAFEAEHGADAGIQKPV